MTPYAPRHLQKTYLSRAMTRVMGMDAPIGDPFGGPAYKERNDPVSAILSIGAMAGSYMAAGTFAAMTLAQGMIFAGGAMSLAGNITGNSTLTKIGAVVGIVGGVGSLADLPGFNEQVFGGGEALSQTSSSVTNGAANANNGALANTPSGPQYPSSPSVVGAGGEVTPLTGGESVLQAGTGPEIIQNSVVASIPPTLQQPLVNTTQNFTPIQSPLQQQLASQGVATNSMAVAPVNEISTTSKVLDFANKNPMATLVLANTATQGLTSLADYASGGADARLDQLQADADYRTAMAEKLRAEAKAIEDRKAQLNENMALGLNIGVNPNAVSITPPGIINTYRSA